MNEIEKVSETINASECMTSMEVAEITGKGHKHVMRDIRVLLEQGVHESNFGLTFIIRTLPNNAQRKDPYYNITKKGCLILASGYNALLREKIINRWEELEKEKRSGNFVIPSTFSEALMLAAKQAERIEQQQKQIELKDTIISEYEPKANYYDVILSSKNAINISVIAKDYGMSAKLMNKKLNALGVIFKSGDTWLPYAKYAKEGYTKTETISYNSGEGSAVHSKWTQKGRLFLYDLLKKNGILPLIEQ